MTDLFNQPEINIPFSPVHKRENSAASELNLNEHRRKFNHDCFEVLQKLVNGERLTVRGAVTSGLTNSLPRRILDLKEFGILISSDRVGTGRAKYVEYYMTSEDKAKSFQFLLTKSQLAA